jgi:hypothetical protein
MAGEKVRRAHMVTKAYISAWADERNRVDVIDMSRNHGYPSSVNNATVRIFTYEPNVLTHDRAGILRDREQRNAGHR